MSNKVSLSITRGDDRNWPMTVTNSQGQPVDLTGAVFTSSIRKEYNSPVIGNPTVTIVDAAQGKVVINVSNELSAALTVQVGKRNSSYVFDVVRIVNNESVTYLNGYLIVEERVTPVGA